MTCTLQFQAVQFQASTLPWAESSLKYSLNWCQPLAKALGGLCSDHFTLGILQPRPHTPELLRVPDTGQPSTALGLCECESLTLKWLSSPFLCPCSSRGKQIQPPLLCVVPAFWHTARRESFLWCHSSLFIRLPYPLDSDSLEGRQQIFPSA